MLALCAVLRKAVLALTAAAIVMTAPGAMATQVIEITGQRPGTSDNVSMALSSMRRAADFNMMANALVVNDADQVAVVNPFNDVRCLPNEGSSTVSTDEQAVKHSAAIALYSLARSSGRAGRSGQFTVRWADGGSTTYTITGGLGSVALAWEPVRETRGSGLPQAGAVCGTG